jgi:DNA polymerase I-like protein with 3'-5' exonuclease and polymerase domains
MFHDIDPQRAINMVSQSTVIAFDCETTGLTVHDRVCGWVFTDDYASIYVPTRHLGGGNILNAGEFERVLALSFRDRSRRGFRTVGHNLGFDLRMAGKHGVFPEFPLEDTMINEALISDITRGYGLDDCCTRHGVTAKLGDAVYRAIASRFGGMPDRKAMANFHRMAGDDPDVVDYATGDGISTLELWKVQQKMLDDHELRVPWKLECQLIHRVARLHRRGMRVDGEYGEQLRGPTGILETKIATLQSAFPYGFNTNSPKDVEGLYRRAGFGDDDFARTENGAVSFTEGWLKNNEIGERIIAIRQLKKARDSFVTPLVETHNVKGRVHPVLNQSKSDDYGAIGARFSCSEPNLQAFPKRNKEVGKVVRRLIIADDGFEIQEGDAKQQEPRLFAYFSDDERLLQGYRTGTMDIHDITSAGLGLHRDIAKRMAMGILTGMSAKALSGHMGWPYQRALDYHNAFLKQQFPAIRKFQKAAMGVFLSSGYVKSITGRKARLDDKEYAYRAVSRIIQNSGGDLMKTTLLRACEYEEAYPQVQLLMTVHDSLIWQREIGFDTSELIKVCEAVPNEFNLGIPIPYEIGTGVNWAEASYG